MATNNDLLVPTALLGFILLINPALSFSDTMKVESVYQHLYQVMDSYNTSSDTPKFMESYQPFSTEKKYDTGLIKTGYLYDNALALIAFLARGTPEDMNRARIIADAFVFASTHDRYYQDGRLRNAYSAQSLITPQDKTALLPGWWDENQQRWQEDKYQVSTHTGNMAWSVIALITYYKKAGGEPYVNTALRLGKWIETETRKENGYGGGYDGWEPSPEKISWTSVEHNIDVYAGFRMLHHLTGDKKWEERAAHAQNFVDGMWDSNTSHFWTGTSKGGSLVNKTTIPLDTHALAIMAMPDRLKYRKAASWAEKNCLTQADGFNGFDFNTDKDGVWFEGTAQMAVAYQVMNQKDKARYYIQQVRKAKKSTLDGIGAGIIAASHNSVTTGFEWQYPRLLHVGATAWYIFAELGYNPLNTE